MNYRAEAAVPPDQWLLLSVRLQGGDAGIWVVSGETMGPVILYCFPNLHLQGRYPASVLSQAGITLAQGIGSCSGQRLVNSKEALKKAFSLLPYKAVMGEKSKWRNHLCLLSFSRAKDVIIPAKPPVSFFSSRSPVLDLFQGQLDYADHVRQDSEVVVLFFYAPWCGQSIAARAEIEQAASRLSDQVMCASTQAVTVKSALERMALQRNCARLAVMSR